MTITPMLGGTAFKNKGVQPLLDAVAFIYQLQQKVDDIKGETQDGEPVTVKSKTMVN